MFRRGKHNASALALENELQKDIAKQKERVQGLTPRQIDIICTPSPFAALPRRRSHFILPPIFSPISLTNNI